LRLALGNTSTRQELRLEQRATPAGVDGADSTEARVYDSTTNGRHRLSGRANMKLG
jgi:hypothetical protein